MGTFLELPPNFEAANPTETPEQYRSSLVLLTPRSTAVLRAVPDVYCVVAMGASIVVLFLLPWFDRCKVFYRYRSKLHLINIIQSSHKLYCAWCPWCASSNANIHVIAQILA